MKYKTLVRIVGWITASVGFLEASMLKEALFHQGALSSPPSLELGKIVLYFSQKPVFKEQVEEREGGERIVRFFFENVRITLEGRAILDTFNATDKPCCVATLTQRGQKGVELMVRYNAHAVYCTHGLFESIKHDQGFLITFHSRLMLDELTNHRSGVLRTVTRQDKPSIVIDAGHGGKDYGTRGCGIIAEKDLTLRLGTMLAHTMHEQGFQVFLTRTSDDTVALDKRTYQANQVGPHALLISIHANASGNLDAQGVETFYFLPPLAHALRGAAVPWYDAKLAWYQGEKQHCSEQLAQAVHSTLIDELHKNNEVKDRGVKPAKSQLLIGSMIPSILIEVGFLSHHQEALNLASVSYQNTIAQGISKGIYAYLHACAQVAV